ncbi:MAG TPA: transcription antitermination factor NusB [Candidatus Krumholzibacteria bacterium]|nr:transcription antitermination factor NusB [Candidatus Krumholzibacteria bacterium]
MGKRRKGREIVLQSLYASLISGAALQDTLADQLSRRESADDTALFARDLAIKLAAHKADLDAWLRTLVARGWNPDRVGMLERVILTIGLAELRYSPDVPWRVVINEAVELARRYCEDEAIGFVNGVLDRAAAETYPDLHGAEGKKA